MEISTVSTDEYAYIMLSGSVNDGEIAKLETAFREVLGQKVRKVALALEYVPNICSAGLGVIMKYQRLLKDQHKTLEVHGVHDSLYALLLSIHFDKLVKIKKKATIPVI